MYNDEAAAIFRRMLRQFEEEVSSPLGAPCCDGCGRRVELGPYQDRMTDGGVETWSYCADCRAQAMVEIVEVEDVDL